MRAPTKERRKGGWLAQTALVVSILSGLALPAAGWWANWAVDKFWAAFVAMQEDIQQIKIGMNGSVERGNAARVELGRLGNRMERVEARVDRLQERRP